MRAVITILSVAAALVLHLSGVCHGADVTLEQHAAGEFAKYVEQITGAEVPATPKGVCRVNRGKALALVGSAAAAELATKDVSLAAGDLGEEGFLIRSIRQGDQRYLVLLGGGPRGTLYAVYHYLERFCRVGFFADGEHIPKLTEIPVEGINVVQKPRWPVRQYMMDCEYSSYWWDWGEWKREVDWAAKHRFNVLSSNFDFTATWRKVWKRFGVDVPATSLSGPPFHPWAGWHCWAIKPPYPEQFQEFQAELAEKFTRYGRGLGMKMAPDFRGFLGQVPREFHDAYRDRARFIRVPWGSLGFEPGIFIHPDDPLYTQVCRAYAEEMMKRYGTDHLWASHGFLEMWPGKDAQETLAIETASARKNLEAIRAVDPKAVLFGSSWAFTQRRDKPAARAYLGAMPDDVFQVWELPSIGLTTQYRDMDYYWGKRWLLGFLYAYGGTTMLQGDLAHLIQSVQAAAADPKAANCLGICVEPEALRHNYIVFDLLARLGWNPSDVELDAFLRDYAERRYGKAAAPKMTDCLRQLVESVYGDYYGRGVVCPLYMLRITSTHLNPERPYGVRSAKRCLPHLQRALETALEESPRLGDSPLYQHDLIDIARQYLSDTFNLHVALLVRAFHARDKAAFERQARILREILVSQEKLLSSSDYYCLAPLLAKAKALPHAPKDYDQRVRDILTVWGGKIPDYAHRDYYELVRFYYRKRFDAFLQHARQRFGSGASMAGDRELATIYHAIEQSWVKKPFEVAPSDKYSLGPAQAVAEILRKHPVTGFRGTTKPNTP